MRDVRIRHEEPGDADAIAAIHIHAFLDHPYSLQTEHLIVDALRDADALEVSLVAVTDGQVVGHVAFSDAAVGEETEGWSIAGPIGVLPDFQRRGIGSALMRAGIEELRALGAKGCVLVGDPAFYGPLGFRGIPGLLDAGVPDEFVMGLPFGDGLPQGAIKPHSAFWAGMEGRSEA